ncbi:Major pollen allergen Aln g 1 [Rhynchospora pubera]|uniref:Major pollen allergen Aln g 1 n=1 Tax=Rhynchospora pubera TaxID=906938 RepID=A0AAV8HHJ4_9POAL|nr:Major pollen allergen Aln g 1 [Rhynchospora pubera]KAJ4817189.1 Major pollen allergen Aln g 1 [Rhynchospora pubera]
MSSSWSCEIESAVPAPRLFRASMMDWHNLAPKLASDKIVSAAVEGDGSVGSVRQFNFAPGMPFTHVKERFDFIDIEKFEVKRSLIEGGGIGTHVESASAHTIFVPKDGGCVVKVVGTYKPLPGANTEEEAERVKGSMIGIIKTAESYLLANPDAYN